MSIFLDLLLLKLFGKEGHPQKLGMRRGRWESRVNQSAEMPKDIVVQFSLSVIQRGIQCIVRVVSATLPYSSMYRPIQFQECGVRHT